MTLRAGGGLRPAAPPPRPGQAAGACFPGGGAVLLLNPPAGGFSPFRARGGERGAARRSGLGLRSALRQVPARLARAALHLLRARRALLQ